MTDFRLSKITIEMPLPLLCSLQGMMIGSLAKDFNESNFPDKVEREILIHSFQKNLLEIESSMLNYMDKEDVRERRNQVAEIIGIPVDELKTIIKEFIDYL